MQDARGASLSDADTQPRRADRPPRRVGALLVVAAVVWALDQMAKAVVMSQLPGHGPVRLLGGLLTLTLVRNAGAAFGLDVGSTIVFTVVAVVVIAAIVRSARRLRSTGWAAALGLVLGGATGNLTDRLTRDPGPLRGKVVDFLELPHWPVFNLADSAICVGAAIIVVLSALGRQLDGTRQVRDSAAAGDETTAGG